MVSKSTGKPIAHPGGALGIELTDGDWPTIPQVYLKGEFVGGADIMYSSELRRAVLVPLS